MSDSEYHSADEYPSTERPKKRGPGRPRIHATPRDAKRAAQRAYRARLKAKKLAAMMESASVDISDDRDP